MQRISTSVDASLIGHTLRGLPSGIRRIFGEVDFVVGVSPLWIGLHRDATSTDGRSFSRTSHVCYAMHQWHLSALRRRTTVVLLDGDERDHRTILHELGHVLDDRIGFQRPDFTALDSYAATNQWEAFATAFQSWATPVGPDDCYYHNRQRVLRDAPEAAAFFNSFV